MMRLTALITTALVTAPGISSAFAHPGHDHTYTPGGEQHHLLWAIVPVVAIVAWGITRAAKRKQR